jgi:exonuclease SbcC
MTSIKAELEAGRKDSRSSQEQASSLASRSQCPLCLQPIDENYKKHMLKHFEEETVEREKRVLELEKNLNELGKLRNVTSHVLSEFQSSIPIIEDLNPRISEAKEFEVKLEKEFQDKQQQEKMLRSELKNVRTEIARFDMSQLELTRKQYETAANRYRATEIKLQYSQERKKESSLKIEDFRRRLENAHQKVKRVEKISKMLETIEGIRSGYQSIQPKLRTEFVKILQNTIQQVLDSLRGEEDTGLIVQIDETYTPTVKSQEGYELEAAHLSGGERTLLAFAYRFALGQLIMQARTGHGLQLLLLDEPTESLGREDRSVDRLAEAIARLKAIEQIIAVTHNEAFAEKADYVIRLEKEIDVSKILPEK